MTSADIGAILGLLGLALARVRDDLPLAGSPERSLERAAVEDAAGGLWIVERHDLCRAERKQEIAAAQAFFGERIPEVKAPLEFGPGRYVVERGGAAWQVSPFIAGTALDRPAFAFEGWRGDALADLLVGFRRAALDRPGAEAAGGFSLTAFIRDLAVKLAAREPDVHRAVSPALLRLERELFPRLDRLPAVFSHGDFHPLNVVWSPDGINGLIDFEFCGPRSETYDAALLVGCVGMEDPRSLAGDLVVRFLRKLRAGAGYAAASWETFADLVLALRFAWLSDWLRRNDREMVGLETVFVGMLLDGREGWERAWA